ncbi:MAG: hypothetical protein K9J21_07005 [Bacteroidales bacterium]|nr:hypothetical protein [Bacteroidales bacterium]
MTSITDLKCLRCKHYVGDMKCVAFAGLIPFDIISGENPHTEPHPEQNGKIVFEPIVKDREADNG